MLCDRLREALAGEGLGCAGDGDGDVGGLYVDLFGVVNDYEVVVHGQGVRVWVEQ